MKTEYLLLLSEILDKMDISQELKNLDINTGDSEKDKEELGKELITLLITRIYKCKNEVYTFVAKYKGYYPKEVFIDSNETQEIRKEKEEKYNSDVKSAINKAKDENIISIIKEIMNSEGISSFLFTA